MISTANVRARMSPAGFFRRVPLQPHEMTAPVTPVADTIVLCHLGVPQLDAGRWRLTIDGLVERPLTLTLKDLLALPAVEIEAAHQCAGSPLQPREPTRRICNVIWTGVRLRDVLERCGVRDEARFVWSTGADWGAFAGHVVDAYQKDLALERALADDTLLAVAMNGAPLTPENGFPVRLVVPGYFGTNSVKWLTRITLAARRADGLFVTRFYNDAVLDAAGRDTGMTLPVWSLHPEAVIVAPAPGAKFAAQMPTEIWGWAWGDHEIDRVDVSTDGGRSWQAARLSRRRQRSWQRFSLTWRPDAGPAQILVRATDRAGVTQPAQGWRNAVHGIDVEVVEDENRLRVTSLRAETNN